MAAFQIQAHARNGTAKDAKTGINRKGSSTTLPINSTDIRDMVIRPINPTDSPTKAPVIIQYTIEIKPLMISYRSQAAWRDPLVPLVMERLNILRL